MKKIIVFCLFLYLFNMSLFSKEASVEEVLANKLDKVGGVENKNFEEQNISSKKTIDFRFKDLHLVDLINLIAAEKKINVILPIGAFAIKAKLTINIPDRLSIDESWDFLHTVLDVAGYSIIFDGNLYRVVKNDANLYREPLKIYISVPYNELPDTAEKILYLAYFSNIQVPDEQNAAQSGLGVILKELLSKGAVFKFAKNSNGVIIIDRSNVIRSVMKVLTELDKVGFKEKLEIVKLRYSYSDVVAKLLNESILEKKQRPQYRLGRKKKGESKYFASDTKVISEVRTNSLILLGKEQSIKRVKDFILGHIDVPIEEGRSILHTKRLQYLDAAEFAGVLRNIVGRGAPEGAQSKAGAGGYGPERYFDGVIIQSDKPAGVETGKEEGKFQYYGTNSLIIAANNDDWEKIERLIEDLDKPQPQVIIEVLIVDINVDENKLLGTSLRNPENVPIGRLSKDGQPINAQSAQAGQVVTEALSESETTLAADLMKPVGAENAFIPGAAGGSTLVSFNDSNGRTWSLLKIISFYDHAKILSHPYVVAINNKQSTIKITEERILDGGAEDTSSGGTRRKKVPINAGITILIRPRIGATENVNLEVNIDISDFLAAITDAGNTNARATRKIVTNANVKSGDILTLGGLIKEDFVEEVKATPILGKIPILGYFFKQRQGTKRKNNLTVFIRPIVIEPRLRGGMGKYTVDYIDVAKGRSKEGMLFDTLRDPINRWFFKTGSDPSDALDDFSEQYKKSSELKERVIIAGNYLNQEESIISKDTPGNQSKNITDELSHVKNNVQSESGTQEDERLKRLVENEENPLLQYSDSMKT